MNKYLKGILITLSVLIIFIISSLLLRNHNYDFINTVTNQQNLQTEASVITVEVLNGCGVQGLSNKVTQYLRENKFDVVYVGSYQGGFDLDRTFVFDRVSFSGYNAKKVGEVLGVNEKQVQPQLDEYSNYCCSNRYNIMAGFIREEV